MQTAQGGGAAGRLKEMKGDEEGNGERGEEVMQEVERKRSGAEIRGGDIRVVSSSSERQLTQLRLLKGVSTYFTRSAVG